MTMIMGFHKSKYSEPLKKRNSVETQKDLETVYETSLMLLKFIFISKS